MRIENFFAPFCRYLIFGSKNLFGLYSVRSVRSLSLITARCRATVSETIGTFSSGQAKTRTLSSSQKINIISKGWKKFAGPTLRRVFIFMLFIILKLPDSQTKNFILNIISEAYEIGISIAQVTFDTGE